MVLPTRRIDWLVVVCATAKPQPPHNFSATLQGFLPSKLEPLGVSFNAWFIATLFVLSSVSGHSMVTLKKGKIRCLHEFRVTGAAESKLK